MLPPCLEGNLIPCQDEVPTFPVPGLRLMLGLASVIRFKP